MRHRALYSPEALAFSYLIDGEESALNFSYAKLDEEARRIAVALSQMAEPGDRILMLYPPCAEFIPAFFGCLYAGMLAVPAYLPKRNRHAQRLHALIKDAGAKVALCDLKSLAVLKSFAEEDEVLRSLSWVASDSTTLPDPSDWRRPEGLGPESTAFLQYTSGSTGSPKGVIVSHGNLIHNSSLMYQAMGHDAGSHCVSWLPTFHDLGLILGVLQPIYGGFRGTLMAPNAFLQKPLRWLRAVSRAKASSTAGPNFAFDLCCAKADADELRGLDLSSLRCVLVGAEPVRASTLEAFCGTFAPCGFKRQAFTPAFGMAEATLMVSGGPRELGPRYLDIEATAYENFELKPCDAGDPGARRLVACGEILAGQSVLSVDPTSLAERGEGELGEIWIQGPSVAQGYWRRGEATLETFQAYTSDSRRGPYLRTGDLGFIKDGQLYISGRHKDLIIIRGVNHFPQDIEQSVEEAGKDLRPGCGAAFSVDFGGEERLVIVYELVRHPQLELAELMLEIRRRLSQDHDLQAQAIRLIKPGTVPKTSSGKIQRRACRKAFLDNELELVASWDEGALEGNGGSQAQAGGVLERIRAMAAAACKAPLERVCGGDSLPALGLDSLALIEFKHALDKALGVETSLEALISGMSLAELARGIEAGRAWPEGSASAGLAAQGSAPEATPAQKALWILEKAAPGTAIYSVCGAWEILGELEPDLLKSCLGKILGRHEALRGGLREEGQTLRLFTAAPGAWDFDAPDFSHWSGGGAWQAAREAMALEASRPFELSKPPLFRARLYRLAPGRSLFFLAAHHAVIDGWSMKLLWRDLSLLLSEALEGRNFEFKDPAPRFGAWAESPASQGSPESLQYWRSRFSEIPPALELPTDRPRPSRQDHRAGQCALDLGPAELEALKRFAQGQGCGLFALLLAAFEALLHRLSGQNEFCVGVPAANRSAKGSDAVVGFLVNTLALPVKADPGMPFGVFLMQTQRDLSEALRRQDLPFPSLVRELNLTPDPSRHPLFQSLLVYQGPNFAPGQVGGLRILPADAPCGGAKLDLALSLEERGGRLHGCLEYRRDLFDDDSVRRWAGHFCELLGALPASVETPLGRLRLMGDEEAKSLMALGQGAEAKAARPGALQHLLELAAASHAGAAALEEGGQSLSYRGLNERANRLAQALRSWGVQAEEPVAICCERSIDWAVAILGVLKAGAAFVPLDPAHPRQRLEGILLDCGASVLISHRGLPAALGLKSKRVHQLDADHERLGHFGAADPVGYHKANQLAYVIYTSGSTGKPKGVMVEQQSLVNHSLALAKAMGLKAGDRVLQSVSPAFDAALEELFPALVSGACLVFGPSLASSSAGDFLAAIQNLDIQLLHLPTAYWSELLGALPKSGAAAPGLKALVVGGDSPTPAQALAWMSAFPGARFLHAYGPTEATITCTLFEADLDWLERHDGAARLPIGRPIQGCAVYVLNESMALQPPGIPGELCIAGLGLARGYLGQVDAGRRFLPDPFGAWPRIYRSGDRVSMSTQGQIEFRGRADDQVKLRGQRIELGEIEAALLRIAGVSAAAVALKGQGGAKRLVAYTAGGAPEAELRSRLAAELPAAMLPSQYVALERLPLTASGKIDRAKLPEPLAEAGPQGAAAMDELEGRVAAIFAKILGIPQPGREGNFFSLGGHSLLAMQLASEIQAGLGKSLGLEAVFSDPTVAGLARRLRASAGAGAGVGSLPRSEAADVVSVGQEAFWYFDQLRPGSPVYNMAAAWTLSGPLDLDALRESLGALLERHESLRTSFDVRAGEAEGGGPLPHLNEAGPMRLPVDDMEAFPSSQRMRQLQRALSEECRQPFGLAQGPLLRARLYRLQAREHCLLLVMHHICADGASLQLMMGELKAIYEAKRDSQPASLPAPRGRYADFAAWQRAWLEGGEAAAQAAYWKAALAGLPPLELPLDKPRPPAQSFEGGSVEFSLEGELLRRLRLFCSGQGVTMHEFLLTAFLLWQQRLSRQESLACGIPVANRRHGNAAGIVGLFMNTVAIRYDAAGDPDFAGALLRVRKACLGAYANQDLPFERVVEALGLPRDPGRQPLIQSMLAFQDLSGLPRSLGEAAIEPLPLASPGARFDLTLHMADRGGRISASLEFASDLFEAATAERFVSQFLALLQGALNSPELPVSRLPLMDEAEEERVIKAWNKTQAPYPQARIHELFEEQADLRPDAVAAWRGSDAISYGALDRQSNRLARRLLAMGLKRGDLVGLYAEKELSLLVGMLGVLKAGGAYLPLDTSYPAERIGFMVEDAQPAVILSQRRLESQAAGLGARLLLLDGGEDWELSESAERLQLAGSPEDLAYVIYTSGSTGRPKGVMIEHRGICRLARNARYPRPAAGDVMAQQASHSFDMSTDEIWSALANGASLVLMSKEEVLNPDWLRREMALRGISHMVLATPIFNHLASQDARIFSGLKVLSLGGEALDPNWVREVLKQGPPGRLINAYGPTECTVWATCEEVKAVPLKASSVPIGRPISNDEAYVLDAKLRPLPVGVPGELCLGGAGLARGYLRRPELSAEKFVSHPLDPSGTRRVYRTGDLARWLPDGRIDYLGRMDQQVKVNGYRIELGEIEAVLGSHPQVLGAVAMALKLAEGDVRLAAFLSCKSGAKPSAEELLAHARAKLPENMVPRHFVFLEALPLNANGKVDRKQLASMPLSEEEGPKAAHKEPADAMEAALLAIWRELLLRHVSVEDDFFKSGGHSLLAVRLAARIRKELGLELSLGELLRHPSVSGLASFLRARRPAAEEGMLALEEGGSGIPLFIVHPIGGSVHCYAPLAAQLRGSRPVWAFEAAALSKPGQPKSSLPELAADYVAALKKAKPLGPYHLAGWSFGALVAYEMACMLEDSGSQVAFLGLMDPSNPGNGAGLAPMSRPEALAQKFVADLAALSGAKADFSAPAFLKLDAPGRMGYLASALQTAKALPPGMEPAELGRLFAVFEAHALAMLSYKPRTYHGRVSLFMASQGGAGAESAACWRKLCFDNAETHVLPGDHYGILAPEQSARLAAAMVHCLNGAEAGLARRRQEVAAWPA